MCPKANVVNWHNWPKLYLERKKKGKKHKNRPHTTFELDQCFWKWPMNLYRAWKPTFKTQNSIELFIWFTFLLFGKHMVQSKTILRINFNRWTLTNVWKRGSHIVFLFCVPVFPRCYWILTLVRSSKLGVIEWIEFINKQNRKWLFKIVFFVPPLYTF